MNTVAILGRLTADPELRSTQNGIAVCSFRVAVDRRYSKDRERQADFVPCVAWRQTAEFVAKHFTKGKMIGVEGALQTRDYEDRDGNKRFVMEVLVSNVSFTGDKAAKGAQPCTQLPGASAGYSSGGAEDFDEITDDGDLPF